MIRRLSVFLTLVAVVYMAAARPIGAAADPPKRWLANGWEVYDELAVPPGAEAAVRERFPSFEQYQDLALYHPAFGYYASGRVDFANDFQTFPTVLAPQYGAMVAEQIFRMWSGMRAVGTLTPDESFTIAEFGGGDGTLAASILLYIDRRRQESPESAWADFARQAIYASYDRSEALSALQRRLSGRFGVRFDARAADATNPSSWGSPPGSVKGVVLSNEMPDAFAVQKLAIAVDGTAQVAYVVPSLSPAAWTALGSRLTPEARERIDSESRAAASVFLDASRRRVYLTREGLVTVLTALAAANRMADAHTIDFREAYVPLNGTPDLAEYFVRYGAQYARAIKARNRGVVTYVNLAAGRFIKGAADLLSAGYVMTIDYGDGWEGTLAIGDRPHLRVYGRGNYGSGERFDHDGFLWSSVREDWKRNSDPYRWPALNDITTDVNFGYLADEGRLYGLTQVFLGGQRAIQAGTSIRLQPPDGMSPAAAREFAAWARDFQNQPMFKVLIQQKAGTDDAYAFPGRDAR